MATPIDLTTLENVKEYLGAVAGPNQSAGHFDDTILSRFITAMSQFIYDECGRDILFNGDGEPTGGMFNEIATYTEVFDGNGGARWFPRNAPVQSITSIVAGNITLPASTGLASPGYFIEQAKRSVAIRTGFGASGTYVSFNNWGGGYVFGPRGLNGIGNCQGVYSAGYAGVPTDLEEACIELVALLMSRKSHVDLATQGNPSAGSTAYLKGAMRPETAIVIEKYKRRALV